MVGDNDGVLETVQNILKEFKRLLSEPAERVTTVDH